jgi:DNA-3-methyladenine glycosylase I
VVSRTTFIATRYLAAGWAASPELGLRSPRHGRLVPDILARVPLGVIRGEDGVRRCSWGARDALYAAYHDHEWGFPVRDDGRLFEKICLEGFQAGLSWLTILRKRDNFRRAFAGFEIEKVARFRTSSVERLLRDPGIVRHRGKIEAAIQNARSTRELVDEWGSLAAYVWRFEPPASRRPRRLTGQVLRRLTETEESRSLSRDLKARGFRFVGPTTMYAFMQSMGLVNDHLEGCDARPRAREARARFRPPRAR